MFRRTVESLRRLVRNFKRFLFICRIAAPAFTAAYAAYMICSERGVLWVNISLALLSVAYIVFSAVTYDNNDKSTRRLRKSTGRIYKRVKHLLRAFAIIAMTYGVYVASSEVHPIAVVVALISIVVWLIELAAEIAVHIVESQVRSIFDSIKADVSEPVGNVKRFFVQIFRKDADAYYSEELSREEEKATKK